MGRGSGKQKRVRITNVNSQSSQPQKEEPTPRKEVYMGARDTIVWRLPDKTIHREDGPARELVNGKKEWLQHGLWHREDGAAIESNGHKEYWLNGKQLSEEEHKKITRKKNWENQLKDRFKNRDLETFEILN